MANPWDKDPVATASANPWEKDAPVGGAPAQEQEKPGPIRQAIGTAVSDVGSAFNPMTYVNTARTLMHPSSAFAPLPPRQDESQMPQDAFHRVQRALGGGPNNTAERGPQMSGPEVAGHVLGAGAMGGLAKVLPKAIDAIPSTERAGQNFQRVNEAVGKTPVDLTKASEPIFEAAKLERTGSGAPPAVISKLSERLPQHGGVPVPFEESRLFQSNAGRLSTAEQMAAKPQMQRQVSLLAKALAEENQRVAEEGGVGPLYNSAMNEYRRAMKIQGMKDTATDIAKKTATRVVLGGMGVGAGVYGARKLFGE